MSKFTCKCGNTINLSTGWSDSELTMIPSSIIEKIGDLLVGEHAKSDVAFFDLIDSTKINVIHCDQCGRYHIEKRGERGRFATYFAES